MFSSDLFFLRPERPLLRLWLVLSYLENKSVKDDIFDAENLAEARFTA